MKKKKKDKDMKEEKKAIKSLPAEEPTAHSYDRDKNKIYEATDESVDEVMNDEGYRNVIHPNRDLGSRGR